MRNIPKPTELAIAVALEREFPECVDEGRMDFIQRLAKAAYTAMVSATPQEPTDATGANGQSVKLLTIGGRTVEVDSEIAPIVAALNAAGVPTRASCSGHGRRPANIALSDGREIIIARDHTEGRRIDALFPIGINGEPTDDDAEWLRGLMRRLDFWPSFSKIQRQHYATRLEAIAERLQPKAPETDL
jgi:hypothetical protein